MHPSNTKSHLSKSCSIAAADVGAIAVVFSLLYHLFSPWIISLWLPGLAFELRSHWLSCSIAWFQLVWAVCAWHWVMWCLFSASCWHHGHLSSCCNFHLLMFVPCGRKFAANFATHHCWAFGKPQIALPATSKSTMLAFPDLYCCFLSNVPQLWSC